MDRFGFRAKKKREQPLGWGVSVARWLGLASHRPPVVNQATVLPQNGPLCGTPFLSRGWTYLSGTHLPQKPDEAERGKWWVFLFPSRWFGSIRSSPRVCEIQGEDSVRWSHLRSCTGKLMLVVISGCYVYLYVFLTSIWLHLHS